jgi:hypothetical protein
VWAYDCLLFRLFSLLSNLQIGNISAEVMLFSAHQGFAPNGQNGGRLPPELICFSARAVGKVPAFERPGFCGQARALGFGF